MRPCLLSTLWQATNIIRFASKPKHAHASNMKIVAGNAGKAFIGCFSVHEKPVKPTNQKQTKQQAKLQRGRQTLLQHCNDDATRCMLNVMYNDKTLPPTPNHPHTDTDTDTHTLTHIQLQMATEERIKIVDANDCRQRRRLKTNASTTSGNQ